MTTSDPVAPGPGPGPGAGAGGVCPGCGYDLRGIDGGRCPECGLAQGGAEAWVIPWQQRQEVGRRAAFWRTVWMGTVRPRRLAMAMAGAVDAASARRFRWWVVVLASLPPIVFFLVVVWRKGGTGFAGVSPGRAGTLLPWLAEPWSEAALVWSAGATLPPVLPAGWVVTCFLVTGAPGYWFRPGYLEAARQDRAVALSRYACAALAWLAVPVGLAAAAAGMTAAGYRDPPPPLAAWGIPGVLAVALFAAAWRTSLVVLARTTHCGTGRVVSAGFGLVLSWAFSAAVGLGVIPFVVGLLWIAVDSFR